MEYLAISAIVLALAFDFVNGFHDTANAVATVIYSGALKPRVAIAMSATLNLLGAMLVGTTVAMFITSVVPAAAVSLHLVIAVLLAGLAWNIVTWWRGLPVSSSHCLLGSLVGAGIAAAGFSGINPLALEKALVALLVSPIIGFAMAYAITWVMRMCFDRAALTREAVPLNDPARRPSWFNKALPWMQILSSASVSFSHGGNDGQKTMGIITLILATSFASAGYSTAHVPFWVVVAAAAAIGLGGGRVIRTVGEKLSSKRIDAAHGCAAEVTTAVTVFGASFIGVPVSTTHVLTSAVVGGTEGLYGRGHSNLSTMKSVFLAWVLTLPVCATLAAGLFWLLNLAF
jgi:inorganic phosphate transporter, PiT family